MEVKFYQMFFSASMEIIVWFWSLFSFLWHSTSVGFRVLNHWTILVNSGWIPLGHSVWSFCCVVGFGFLIFSWESLPLFSSKILACNFLFWYCLCLVLVSGWWWLHKVTLGLFPPIYSLERVWERSVQVLFLFGRIGLWSHLVLAFYSLGGGFLFFLFFLFVWWILFTSILWSVLSNYFFFGSVLLGHVSKSLPVSPRLFSLLAYNCS